MRGVIEVRNLNQRDGGSGGVNWCVRSSDIASLNMPSKNCSKAFICLIESN